MVSKRIVLFTSKLIQDPTHKVHLTTHNTNLQFLLVQKIYSPFLFVFAQFVVTDLLIFILAGNEVGQVFMIGHGQSRENSSETGFDRSWPITSKRSARVQQTRQRTEKTRA